MSPARGEGRARPRGSAGADAETRYARAARRLMLAYPPRYREYRGDELLATLLDLAEPGQTRPPLRDCLDVVRGGLALRLREHPRPGPWLRYRVLNQRLPYEYRWWARDRLLAKRPRARFTVMFVLWWGPWMALLLPAEGPVRWTLSVGVMAVCYVVGWVTNRRRRIRMLAMHEFDRNGLPFPVAPPAPLPPPARPRPLGDEA
ncbi:hypothetical protein [Microbispora sp. NPDC049125]|uniref:hypothetical protein n=1 Tax=Microbispora sp. NPDC049125 TaxID=3154929 RepID=UPI003466BA61